MKEDLSSDNIQIVVVQEQNVFDGSFYVQVPSSRLRSLYKYDKRFAPGNVFNCKKLEETL